MIQLSAHDIPSENDRASRQPASRASAPLRRRLKVRLRRLACLGRGVAVPLVWSDGGSKRALVAPLQRLKSPPIERMVEGRMKLVWLCSSRLDVVSR